MTVKLWLKIIHKFIIVIGVFALVAVITGTATKKVGESVVGEESFKLPNRVSLPLEHKSS